MGSDDWVVLELNQRSEGEDPSIVRASIQKSLPKTEVFLPVVVTKIGDDTKVHYLVEGYAFVRRGDYPDSAFVKLEATRFVQSVLSQPGTYGRHRRFSVVHTRDIDKMRQQVQVQVHQGIGIGDRVRITTGPYRNIEASVIEEIPEQGVVQVFVELRSKKSIVTIPRSGLQVLERAPLSPLLSKLTDLRAWIRQARPVLLWPGDIIHLHQLYDRCTQVAGWMNQGRSLFAQVMFGQGALDANLARIRTVYETLRQLTAWDNRFRPLFAFVRSFYDTSVADTLRAIHEKLVALAWFEDIEERIVQLDREIDSLGHHATKGQNEENFVVQNLLIDGFNLMFRCWYAPGITDLKDSTGRPTGALLGFLRSLGSLRKRYPEARLYVVWDGAARRRKKAFPDYKAHRPQRNQAEAAALLTQYEALQRILPTLDVRQAVNAEEEADDVIASLVRGELSSQNNLIFSTDRDLLQLVSETTQMLMPGTGIRKEILYDVAQVQANFGVPPTQLLQLRAFYGDASDNIPGTPRVPKKVLCSLVQAHGTVEAVYKSGLTGVSKGQYERLRSSEPQVKINLALMGLVDVAVSLTHPDVDPDLATSMLEEFEISPSPLLDAFYTKAEATE